MSQPLLLYKNQYAQFEPFQLYEVLWFDQIRIIDRALQIRE